MDIKSNDIIEISVPNNPKIDTHNDISVIFLKFWCDSGRRVTLGRRAGRRTSNLMILSNSAAQITPKSTPITIYLSSSLNFCVTAAAGDPWTAGGAADLKSNGIFGISGPINPKIDTHNDIPVISFKF